MKLAELILESVQEKGLRLALEAPLREDLPLSTLSEEDQKKLDEAIGPAFIIGAILAAPKIIEYIGRIVQWVSKIFKKLLGKSEEEQDKEVAAAKWIEHQGHALHTKYIKVIKWVVKNTGFASKFYTDENGKVDEKKLETTAEFLLYIGVAVAAAFSVYGSIQALTSGSPIMGALEAGLSGTKADELIIAVKKLAPKLSGFA
jgi:hypothetical protein